MSILNQYTKPILSFLAVYVPQVLGHYYEYYNKRAGSKNYNIFKSLLLRHGGDLYDEYDESNTKIIGFDYTDNFSQNLTQRIPITLCLAHMLGKYLAGDDASLALTIGYNVSCTTTAGIIFGINLTDISHLQFFIAQFIIPTVLLTLINYDYDKNLDDVQPQDILDTPEFNIDDVQPQDIITFI